MFWLFLALMSYRYLSWCRGETSGREDVSVPDLYFSSLFAPILFSYPSRWDGISVMWESLGFVADPHVLFLDSNADL